MSSYKLYLQLRTNDLNVCLLSSRVENSIDASLFHVTFGTLQIYCYNGTGLIIIIWDNPTCFKIIALCFYVKDITKNLVGVDSFQRRISRGLSIREKQLMLKNKLIRSIESFIFYFVGRRADSWRARFKMTNRAAPFSSVYQAIKPIIIKYCDGCRFEKFDVTLRVSSVKALIKCVYAKLNEAIIFIVTERVKKSKRRRRNKYTSRGKRLGWCCSLHALKVRWTEPYYTFDYTTFGK